MADFELVPKAAPTIDWKNLGTTGPELSPTADTLHNAAKYQSRFQAGGQAEALDELAGRSRAIVEPAPGMVKAVPEVPTSQPNFLHRVFGYRRGSPSASWLSRVGGRISQGARIGGVVAAPAIAAGQTAFAEPNEIAAAGKQFGIDNPDENDLSRALSYGAYFLKKTSNAFMFGQQSNLLDIMKNLKEGKQVIRSLNAAPEAKAAVAPVVASGAAAVAPAVQANEAPAYEKGGGTITMGGRTVRLPGVETVKQTVDRGMVKAPAPTAADYTKALGDFRGRGLAALIAKRNAYNAEVSGRNLTASNAIKATIAAARYAAATREQKPQLHYEPSLNPNEAGSVINLETGARTQTYIPLRAGETPDSVRAYVKGQVKSGNMKDEDAAKYLKNRRIAAAK